MILRIYSEVGLLLIFSLCACISHSDTMEASPQGGS